MSAKRYAVGLLIGSAMTGIVFAVHSYTFVIDNHSSTIFGPASSFWTVAVAVGLVFGILIGGLAGAIIVGFKMRIALASLFNGVVNMTVVLWIYLNDDSVMNSKMQFSLFALIPIGIITGAVVSMFASSKETNLK